MEEEQFEWPTEHKIAKFICRKGQRTGKDHRQRVTRRLELTETKEIGPEDFP